VKSQVFNDLDQSPVELACSDDDDDADDEEDGDGEFLPADAAIVRRNRSQWSGFESASNFKTKVTDLKLFVSFS